MARAIATADIVQTLRQLMAERDPIYARADAIVHSREVPHETIVEEILAALAERLGLEHGPDRILQQDNKLS